MFFFQEKTTLRIGRKVGVFLCCVNHEDPPQVHMCERRGSGIDRATDAIGEMKLPAYKAQSGDDYTRITSYIPFYG